MQRTQFRRLATGIAVLAAATFVAAGCGDDDSKDDSSSSSSKTTTSESSTAKASTASAISSPGVDLRVTLDRLLAEHASLAWVATTKTYAGEADAAATVEALNANSDDLAEAMGSIYGDTAADEFLSQWNAHIGMFVDYTTALKGKDAAGQKAAVADLTGYTTSFAKFLAGATGVNEKAAQAALTAHVLQLKAGLDAFAKGDYPTAYAKEREAYNHMYMTGDALAGAITTQKPEDFGTGDVTTAAADTRVTVDRQLAEHAFLAALATTKSLAGAKDATAAVGALTANSNDLAKTIGSVYGATAQKEFLAQWNAHIGMFVDYTTALAKGDDAAKQAAADDLAGYTTSFAKFLATATDGDEAAYQKSLESHVSQLAGALDAAKAGDANKAWELEREAYAHMFMTGDALVSAIVAQNPDKFGGDGTTGGGDSSAAAESHDSMEG